MRGLVAESTFVTIRAIDPTIIFSDTYNNRTYDLPEKNETTSDGYKDVLIFGAREKKTGYYYWYWARRISCSITKGNVNNTFIVTYRSYYYGYGDDDQYFKLRVRSLQLDREATSEYNIEITCKNIEYKDATRAVTTIHVQILDANDNLPVFEKEIYNAKIPKSIKGGEDIIQVVATDDDIDENGKIRYSLVHSSDSYIFTIDEMSGVISLKSVEQLARPYYTLTAVATDQGTPPRSGYVTVALEVQNFPTPNRTNNNPIFVQHQYTAYLLWGTPRGTVVTTVHAHDPVTFDHQNIRYSLFSGDDSVFKVDSKTGVITTKGDVKKMQYNLNIAAEYEKKPGQKPGEFYNITSVVVLVRKIDTSQPHFEESHYTAAISENTRINTKVLTVKAFYKHKERLEYSIPTPRGMFKIDKDSGDITLIAELDYEKEQHHTFVVSAKDPKSPKKSTCTDVTINVLDYNDNAPVINYYPRSITVKLGIKGRREIGHISASDKDNGTNSEIKYYLDSSDYNGVFSIDRDNGKLYVNGALFVTGSLHCCDVPHDYSSCNCTLRVTAKDQGIPPKEAEVEIIIIPYDPKKHHNPTRHIHNPSDAHHTGKHHGHNSSNQKTYIIASVIGGVVIIIILAGAIYWQRRRRQRMYASTTMNYMNLPSDEEDEDLLDPASDHEDDNDNGRRLSLISAASDDNLLRNEAPC
ncbi:protocadherin Fat 2 [Paramuricea clavata]|uniref:Protocadherin Fat 2 n=2 Tax=Paramuricea clavata TaxID=317549 RepID=A0A6S7GNB4_PARCT|nr:protocadherin Fat 2 [Paramuricea clavata]